MHWDRVAKGPFCHSVSRGGSHDRRHETASHTKISDHAKRLSFHQENRVWNFQKPMALSDSLPRPVTSGPVIKLLYHLLSLTTPFLCFTLASQKPVNHPARCASYFPICFTSLLTSERRLMEKNHHGCTTKLFSSLKQMRKTRISIRELCVLQKVVHLLGSSSNLTEILVTSSCVEDFMTIGCVAQKLSNERPAGLLH